jgi:hypothetical protein
LQGMVLQTGIIAPRAKRDLSQVVQDQVGEPA